MDAVWEALRTAAGVFWRAFWALALGYAISASIQVFLSRGAAAKYLGDATQSAKNLKELAAFGVDYTFFLNLFAVAVSLGLVCLSRRHTGGSHASSPATP